MKKRPKQEPTLEDLAIFFILIIMMSLTAIGIVTIAFISTR